MLLNLVWMLSWAMATVQAENLTAADSSVFNSSGLGAALQATMLHNPLLSQQQAELQAQNFNINSAKGGRYPTLSAQANNLNENFDQGTLRLQQPLWAFGKIDTHIAQARTEYAVALWDLRRQQRQLIEDTAVAYSKIEGITQKLEVVTANIAEHRRLYQRIQRRFQGKLASQADVSLAYSRLLQAEARRQRFISERMIALNELQALTHIPVPVEQAVNPKWATLPEVATVQEQARLNSAELQYKRQQLDVVRIDIKKERVASTPTLYFRVEHEFLDTQDNMDETRFGLVIEANLEGLGVINRGQFNSATARLQAAQYAIDVTLTDIQRLVNQLMFNRRLQQRLLTSQQQALTALEATMASFLRQYESGRKSWLEVLNTQRELTELRLQLAQIDNDWLLLSLRIAALIGALDMLAEINWSEEKTAIK